jgi:hypothetical protein
MDTFTDSIDNSLEYFWEMLKKVALKINEGNRVNKNEVMFVKWIIEPDSKLCVDVFGVVKRRPAGKGYKKELRKVAKQQGVKKRVRPPFDITPYNKLERNPRTGKETHESYVARKARVKDYIDRYHRGEFDYYVTVYE